MRKYRHQKYWDEDFHIEEEFSPLIDKFDAKLHKLNEKLAHAVDRAVGRALKDYFKDVHLGMEGDALIISIPFGDGFLLRKFSLVSVATNSFCGYDEDESLALLEALKKCVATLEHVLSAEKKREGTPHEKA